uniref:Peptidase S1 domain-containing protein n=1 Tax=Photinus pyralis TaxID=7054 RepID=A0A1Y1N4B7_PHOPY
MLNVRGPFLISTCIILTYGFQSCSLPYNEIGKCVDLKQCPELQRHHLASRISLNTSKDQCDYFKVCCPTTSTHFKNSKRIKKSVRISQNDHVQCGIQYPGNRIFGGTITDLHEFPWMALLIYQTEKGPGLACGGVLISQKYVLTAAHCVTGPSMRKVGKLIAVRLGEHNIETPVDCDDDEIDEDCALPHMDIFIESATPHPNYTAESSSKYNDIALIKLNQAVNYTKDVQPICLGEAAQVSKWNNPGADLVVSGWGQTETRGKP